MDTTPDSSSNEQKQQLIKKGLKRDVVALVVALLSLVFLFSLKEVALTGLSTVFAGTESLRSVENSVSITSTVTLVFTVISILLIFVHTWIRLNLLKLLRLEEKLNNERIVY